MALSRVLARRVGMLRGLATATFSKPGPPSQVVVLGNDVAVKSLGDNEVSLRFLAAPVTSTDLKTIEGKLATPSLPAVPGSEGVGVVTAVGSKVTGLAPDDWVVPTIPTLGTWRSVAKAKASELAKVPKTIPVEYAANLHSAITAYALVTGGGAKMGDLIVQNQADSTVGLAIVQIAAKLGIRTINILEEDRPGYLEVAGLIKELGGDVVVETGYVGSAAYKKLVSDMPAPKLAINALGEAGASFLSSVAGKGATVVSYGEGAKAGFTVSDWFKKESEASRAKAMETLAMWFTDGSLKLWVERHPFCDISYALGEAAEPYKTRKVTLVINELPKPQPAPLSAEDLGKLSAEFESAFKKLRA